MNTMTIEPFKLRLYINSSFDKQPSDTTTNWTTYINPHLPPFKKYSVRIDEIEFPNTAYNFPDYNSILWYFYDTAGANILKYVAIDYNRVYATPQDIITEINNGFTTNGDNITLAYDSNTMKITITNSTTVNIRIVSDYVYEPESSTIYWQISRRLGFTQDLRSTILSPSTSLVGESMLQMLRSQCYYITCNILNSIRADQSRVPNKNFSPSILCRITASNYGTLSQLSYSSSIDFDVGAGSINAIKFNVLDDRLEPISINGYPITMSLIFNGM